MQVSCGLGLLKARFLIIAHCACVAVLVEITGAAEVLSLVHQSPMLVQHRLRPVL